MKAYFDLLTIYLDNEDLGTLSDEAMRKYRWAKIAMVFQGAMNALNPIIRVKEQTAQYSIVPWAVNPSEED